MKWSGKEKRLKSGKRVNSEHIIQVQCVHWFRTQYPQREIFAIPNAAKRSIALAKYLQAEGLTAGVSDLFIPEPNSKYHGLWVEMKAPGNVLTGHQELFLKKMAWRKYAVAVCFSLEEFMKLIREYFST